MSPFATFKPTDYSFLVLTSGVNGTTIVSETPTNGIVKMRNAQAETGDVKTGTSDASVHIRPDEPFLADLGGYVVGHGIRVGQDIETATTYRIVAQSNGHDYDTNRLEFVFVTLERLDVSTWETSLLPLT